MKKNYEQYREYVHFDKYFFIDSHYPDIYNFSLNNFSFKQFTIQSFIVCPWPHRIKPLMIWYNLTDLIVPFFSFLTNITYNFMIKYLFWEILGWVGVEPITWDDRGWIVMIVFFVCFTDLIRKWGFSAACKEERMRVFFFKEMKFH